MLRTRRINTIPDSSHDSSSGEDSLTEVQPIETAETLQKEETTKYRSWVYQHSEKLEQNDKSFFYCRYTFKNGRKCNFKVMTKKGQTTLIANHLKEKHDLKPPTKSVQATLDQFQIMPQKPKSKKFRQAFAEMVTKQYLPFSLIEEKVVQESFIAFYNEWVTTKSQPTFVTDKTVAADIATKAEEYIKQMRSRFQSKLSLCMDAWTGPNKMSFLGITFTYLDDNFIIQRGLLDMVKMKGAHSGENMAKLFQRALLLYDIDKKMVGGVTQDNAANCGTCVDALVRDGYDRGIFYGCFLHILNLACQAAIKVYDPTHKKMTTRIRLTTDIEDSGSEDSHDEEDPDFVDDQMEQHREELEDVSNKSNAILRARNLAVFINRNDSRRETFTRCQVLCNLKTNLLVQDMKVRWNTTYDMIMCLIKNEKVFKNNLTKLNCRL